MTITDSRGLLQIFERNIDINYPDALGSVHFAKEIGNLMISMFGGIRCGNSTVCRIFSQQCLIRPKNMRSFGQISWGAEFRVVFKIVSQWSNCRIKRVG